MPDPELVRRARRAVDRVGVNGEPLLAVVTELYGESYVVGTHTAVGELPATIQAVAPVWEATVNWDEWRPGAARAAAEVAGVDGGRGLARLLDDAQVTIRGINETTRDALALTLAEGLEAGESAANLKRRLAELLDDANRAEMIARTESARAMTVATLDSYRDNGVAGRQWLAASDADPDCAELDGRIVSMDEDFPEGDPPLHPFCRCGVAPVLAEEMPGAEPVLVGVSGEE